MFIYSHRIFKTLSKFFNPAAKAGSHLASFFLFLFLLFLTFPYSGREENNSKFMLKGALYVVEQKCPEYDPRSQPSWAVLFSVRLYFIWYIYVTLPWKDDSIWEVNSVVDCLWERLRRLVACQIGRRLCYINSLPIYQNRYKETKKAS